MIKLTNQQLNYVPAIDKFHWLNSLLLLIKGLRVNEWSIGCGVKLNKKSHMATILKYL